MMQMGSNTPSGPYSKNERCNFVQEVSKRMLSGSGFWGSSRGGLRQNRPFNDNRHWKRPNWHAMCINIGSGRSPLQNREKWRDILS